MTASRDAGTVRVLYFAGSGRSGSTVMTNIIGQLPGCFAAGELRYLWQRGVGEDHRCGCGRPFSECPVWQAVMAQVRGDGAATDEAEIGRRLLQRLRIRQLPLILLRGAAGRRAVPFHADDVRIARLYRALAATTGARTIVDSSKLPPYGLLVGQLPGVDLTIVHVVRDPRATAFSWLRKKETRDRDDGALMQRHETWKSSLLWLVWNVVAALLWPTGTKGVCRVRYEDFVDSPEAVLTTVVREVGLDPADLPFVTPTSVRLQPTHSVAGNPNRHDSGVVQVRADNEWQQGMRWQDRLLVTVLTAPGIVRFGYPLRVRGRKDRPVPENELPTVA